VELCTARPDHTHGAMVMDIPTVGFYNLVDHDRLLLEVTSKQH